jgi:hypothetical protein
MYGEAKLAFILYLWYPKTNVQPLPHSNYYQFGWNYHFQKMLQVATQRLQLLLILPSYHNCHSTDLSLVNMVPYRDKRGLFSHAGLIINSKCLYQTVG